MRESIRRRAFVRAATLGGLGALAGCETLQSSDPTPTDSATTGTGRPTGTSTSNSPAVGGTAVDLSGNPVPGAAVRAVVPGTGTVAETSTDGEGRFGLDTAGRPAWLTVSADGFHDRTVAVEPEARLSVELTPADRTVSLSFCGDVMFARRFYGRAENGRVPHFRISPSNRLADHRRILRSVAPLLRAADITSVNLETALTTTEWRHPEKTYTFASHPVAARALAEAGVGYAALGNNHTLDALEPGLSETLTTLESADIAHSGAGRSSDAAWRPAVMERRGLTFAFLSCTTIIEPQHDIDLSADRGASKTHRVTRETDDGRESITFSGDVGAAEASEERLDRHVRSATDRADLTVVQIHGGYAYWRRSIAKIRGLADAAIGAGADLVICHHPHVTGGLQIRDGALVAWSLGNFVFDQTFWETFPTYVLTAHVGPDGVERAYVDPVLIDGYVPKGVVGEPRADQLWRTAGFSTDEFALDGRTLQYVRGRTPSVKTVTQSFGGEGSVYARETGWPKTVVSGGDAVEFGRDRFPTGRFEDSAVDGQRYGGPLWEFEGVSPSNGPDAGHDGSGGVRLIRKGSDEEPATFGPVVSVPVDGPLTLAGRYRYGSDGGLDVLAAWYADLGESPTAEDRFTLGATGGKWAWTRNDLAPPGEASRVAVTVRLSPPGSGERVAAFDDLRLVEWTADASGGREYDHLRVDGTATVEFATGDSGESAEVAWTDLEG